MKRRITVVLLAALMVAAVVSGCQKAEAKLDAKACARMLSETIEFSDSLTAVSEEMASVLYQTDAADVIACEVFVSTGATAEEIAVFEAADHEAAGRLKEAVLQRSSQQIASFQDYLPTEVPKLQDPYLEVVDCYVIYCVSEHNDAVKAAVKQLLSS